MVNEGKGPKLKPGSFFDQINPGMILPSREPGTNRKVSEDFIYKAREGFNFTWEIFNDPNMGHELLSYGYIFGALQNPQLITSSEKIETIIQKSLPSDLINIFEDDLIPLPAEILNHILPERVASYHASTRWGTTHLQEIFEPSLSSIARSSSLTEEGAELLLTIPLNSIRVALSHNLALSEGFRVMIALKVEESQNYVQ